MEQPFAPLFLSMDVNYLESTHSIYSTVLCVRLVLTDNLQICKRKDKNQSRFESCTYIWVKKSKKKTKLGWGIEVCGIPQYFGFDKRFDKNRILSNRPFNHDSDLLANSINDNWVCYCILGLSEIEARCLEALFISQSNQKLSKIKASVLETGCLINKRREKKYERLINEYLNLESQWK